MSIRADVMAGLKLAVERIMIDSGYESKVALVSEFEENSVTAEGHESPLLMVIDTGTENASPGRDGYTAYTVDILIRGFITVAHKDNIMPDINKLISDFRKLINSLSISTIHANVRGFTYLGSEGIRYSTERPAADVIFNCRLRYVCLDGTY